MVECSLRSEHLVDSFISQQLIFVTVDLYEEHEISSANTADTENQFYFLQNISYLLQLSMTLNALLKAGPRLQIK